MSPAPVVHTCDLHSSVYHHLAASKARDLALTHLDAHCDLKGTFIDVEAGRAWLRQPRLPVSASTYLSHLVAEGITSDVEWVHDEVGGRVNDLGTVLYSSDLDRLAYRLVRRPSGPGIRLAYRESEYAGWRHRDAGRVLDIDWDFFADWRKDAVRIAREIEQLLEEKIEVTPERVYVAYSSLYSRPGRAAYEDFVERLALRLSARIEPIPEAPTPRTGALARALPPSLRRLLRGQVLRLKRLVLRCVPFLMLTGLFAGSWHHAAFADDASPAQRAKDMALAAAIKADDVAAVRKSIDDGANVNVRDTDGSTPLIFASSQGHAEVVDVLLDRGAETTLSSEIGATPLHVAAVNGHSLVVARLLQAKVPLDSRMKEGATGLMYAADRGHRDVVRLLVLAGANLNLEDDHGYTALALAGRSGRAEVVQLLQEATRKQNDAYLAALQSGDAPAVKALLDRGVEVDIRDSEDNTPLIFAAGNGNVDLVVVLLDAGATVDAMTKEGATALMWAANAGHLPVVEKLIEAGATVGLEAPNGTTARSLAAQAGHAEVVAALQRAEKPSAPATIGLDELLAQAHKTLGSDQPGNRVLAQWGTDGFWYPARVKEPVTGGTRVTWDDGGETETVKATRPLDWKVGTHLQCKWPQDGKYYRGVITTMSGDSMQIRWDDGGQQEQTTIAACRSN